MAPMRSAPPPPAASSEETGSGSGSDESEEEEEIAHSPPPAAPKITAPPPQMGQESETDEEEEDDEEEEEEDEKTNHATPPAVPKNPPPPPPNREESETEEEEEGEADDEAPQPKPAEAEGKGSKPPPPSSSEDKRPAAPFQRTWSTDDEVRILEALAAHRREHGTLPDLDALVATLAGSLDNAGYGRKELQVKLRSLKSLYNRAAKRGELPSKDRDRRLFDLSKIVWGGGDKAANGSARREFGEMCELYPFLAEEVKALEKAHPGLFKREFEMIYDDKARALDVKIKKHRVVQMKLELRRYDLTKEVSRALMELVD